MPVTQQFDKDHLNSFKGLLISLIVLGHNSFFSDNLGAAYISLYTFHVSSFLLLPFILQKQPITLVFLRDRTVRYLVPFAFFFLLSSIIYFLLILKESATIHGWALDVLRGITTMSAYHLDKASGFKMYWFLPAFLSTVILLGLWCRLPSGGKLALLAVCALFHLFLGSMTATDKHNVPFGLLIAAFIFLPGLMARLLLIKLAKNYRLMVSISSAVFLMGMIALSNMAFYMNLGDLNVYGIDQWHRMLLQDVLIVSGFLFCFSLCYFLRKVRILQALGKYSLGIYLLHGLVFQFVLIIYNQLLQPILQPATMASSWGVAMLISYAVTLFLAFIATYLIAQRAKPQSLIFPRDWQQWNVAFSFRR